MVQSRSDVAAITRVLNPRDASTYGHAIAKSQQAVEKTIKALVAGLRDAGILAIDIGYRHDVARFLPVLIRMPHAAEHRAFQARLQGLLDAATRCDIDALDRLAPRRPPPGTPAARNTEYPFQDEFGPDWRSPSDLDVFGIDEVDCYRRLAYRLLSECGKLLSFLEHSLL